MKKVITTLLMTIGSVTIGLCGDPPPFNPEQPQGIPIDGGAFALLGMGVGYGLKKVREQKSES